MIFISRIRHATEAFVNNLINNAKELIKDNTDKIGVLFNDGVKKLVQNELLPNLNDFTTLNEVHSVDGETLNKPEAFGDFGGVVNIGNTEGTFQQIAFSRYGAIYSRGYASWEVPRWRKWENLATTNKIDILNIDLKNGWSNYGGGFQGARETRIGDMVYLSGTVNAGTTTANTVIYNSKNAPQSAQIIITQVGEFRIFPNGDLICTNVNVTGYCTLNGMGWSV